MAIKLRSAVDVELIDNLIPEAVRLADVTVPVDLRELPPGRWPDLVKNKWNQVYHLNMDRLTLQDKLRY